MVQLILKLALISKHSQLKTKKMEYWIRIVTKGPQMHPCVGKKSLSKNLRLNLQGQGDSKKKKEGLPSKNDRTLRQYATLCTPPKRWDASM